MTPSLIIETTVNGNDSTDLKVSVDGNPIPDWSSSKALDIDPGEHVVQVTVPDFPPSEKKIIMREGDKRKVISDPHARYFGTELKGGELTTGDDARIGAIDFDTWFAVQRQGVAR